MAVINPPTFLQAGSHPASTVRRAFQGLIGDTSGVLRADDMAVSQSTTPAMQVEVATGMAYIIGTTTSYMGAYIADNQGDTTLAIASSDGTFDRTDIVVARIKDAQYVGADNEFALEVVTGTASASPVTPTTPADSLLLATITVGNGVTSITDANITDSRVTAVSAHAARVVGTSRITSVTDATTTAATATTLSWTAKSDKVYMLNMKSGGWASDSAVTPSWDVAPFMEWRFSGGSTEILGRQALEDARTDAFFSTYFDNLSGSVTFNLTYRLIANGSGLTAVEFVGSPLRFWVVEYPSAA